MAEAEAGQVRYWQYGQAESSPDLAISDLSRFLEPVPLPRTQQRPRFRALEAHANARLTAKLRLETKEQLDLVDRSTDKACRCRRSLQALLFPQEYLLRRREDWTTSLGITLTTLGPVSETVSPSTVLFRGDYLDNTPAGRRKIDALIALFP